MTLLLSALALLGTATAEEWTGDLAALQGQWTARLGPNRDVPLTWTIRGRKVTVQTWSNGQDVTTTFDIRLDEKARPRHMDQTNIRVDFGRDVGKADAPSCLAIYQVKGDKLTVCIGLPSTDRPSWFASGDESDLVELRRARPAPGPKK
jgi:uncharacterized protein (TIGR03067 family)